MWWIPLHEVVAQPCQKPLLGRACMPKNDGLCCHYKYCLIGASKWTVVSSHSLCVVRKNRFYSKYNSIILLPFVIGASSRLTKIFLLLSHLWIHLVQKKSAALHCKAHGHERLEVNMSCRTSSMSFYMQSKRCHELNYHCPASIWYCTDNQRTPSPNNVPMPVHTQIQAGLFVHKCHHCTVNKLGISLFSPHTVLSYLLKKCLKLWLSSNFPQSSLDLYIRVQQMLTRSTRLPF